MTVRVASYNVNNLFRRAKVFHPGFAGAADVLKDVRTLNTLIAKPTYTDSVKTQMAQILKKELDKPTKDRAFAVNEVRDKLFSRSNGQVTIQADGREDWVGSIDFILKAVDESNSRNTARVIDAVGAGVMCVVEVEDRLTLKQFNESLLQDFQADFAHTMLIDGNDERGIDVGLLSKFEIRTVRSHIDDPLDNPQGARTFSRDCPEFEVILPGGKSLWLLGNHFKSKLPPAAQSDARRTLQAGRVVEILGRFDLDNDLVVVAGDLNDFPNSAPLSGLLQTPGLFDVLTSPLLNGPSWTYQDKKQLDYILVSKPLKAAVTAVGIERRGIFSATDFQGQFPHFPEVTSKLTQASDHAALFADFDI